MLAVLPEVLRLKMALGPTSRKPCPAAPLARRTLLVMLLLKPPLFKKISRGAAVSLTILDVPAPIQLELPVLAISAPGLTRCNVALVAPVKSTVVPREPGLFRFRLLMK